eukprot:9520037-Lingulodinium_polyedra.AAC.1
MFHAVAFLHQSNQTSGHRAPEHLDAAPAVGGSVERSRLLQGSIAAQAGAANDTEDGDVVVQIARNPNGPVIQFSK